MGSASQNRFATLLICATKADQNLCRITRAPFQNATKSLLDRFPLAADRLGEDFALVDAVERGAELGAGARTDHVSADILEERELFGAGIERDEVHLHAPLALAPDLARDIVGAAAVGVLAVGDDEQIFA